MRNFLVGGTATAALITIVLWLLYFLGYGAFALWIDPASTKFPIFHPTSSEFGQFSEWGSLSLAVLIFGLIALYIGICVLTIVWTGMHWLFSGIGATICDMWGCSAKDDKPKVKQRNEYAEMMHEIEEDRLTKPINLTAEDINLNLAAEELKKSSLEYQLNQLEK